MLDVHTPHEPIHTRKGFFIHIATICVGLLIAVGLEQSVEAVLLRTHQGELSYELLGLDIGGHNAAPIISSHQICGADPAGRLGMAINAVRRQPEHRLG